MKKSLLILSLSAIVLAVGCAKEQLEPDQPQQTVRIEVLSEAPVKSQLENNHVKWSENDQIEVFAGTVGSAFSYVEAGTDGSGIFEGTLGSADRYYALYPYTPLASISADGVISTTLPAAQTAVTGTFADATNISVGVSASPSFMMKNLCALVKFGIARTDVTAVTLSAATDLAGDLQITVTPEGLPEYTVTSGVKEITLSASSALATGTYYFTVLPQQLDGFKLTYTLADGSKAEAATQETLVLKRAVVANIGTPEPTLVADDVIDLSKQNGRTETANCYVAGLAGQEYKFPATVMGNGNTLAADLDYSHPEYCPEIAPVALAPKSAKLLWQTEKGLVRNVTLQNGEVHFTLNGEKGGALTEGNALIAVYDESGADILWSWHIWVTDDDLDAQVKTLNVADGFVETNVDIMDRNLGALTELDFSANGGTNKDHGLYYQWGRKDPFINVGDAGFADRTPRTTYDDADQVIESYPLTPADAYSNAVAWSYVSKKHLTPDNLARYPMVFYCSGTTKNDQFWLSEIRHNLWGAPNYADKAKKKVQKTIYDPCPAGYHVMSKFALSGIPSNINGGDYSVDNPKFTIESDNATTFKANQQALHLKAADGSTVNFPACGMMFFERFMNSKAGPIIDRVGEWGYMWAAQMSGAKDNMRAYRVEFNPKKFTPMSNGYASYGLQVRCEKIK